MKTVRARTVPDLVAGVPIRAVQGWNAVSNRPAANSQAAIATKPTNVAATSVPYGRASSIPASNEEMTNENPV